MRPELHMSDVGRLDEFNHDLVFDVVGKVHGPCLILGDHEAY